MNSCPGDISIAGVELTAQRGSEFTTAIVQCVRGYPGVQGSCLRDHHIYCFITSTPGHCELIYSTFVCNKYCIRCVSVVIIAE